MFTPICPVVLDRNVFYSPRAVASFASGAVCGITVSGSRYLSQVEMSGATSKNSKRTEEGNYVLNLLFVVNRSLGRII